MRDPLLIDEWSTEIPPSQREQYQREERTDPDHAQLVKSANISHDRIRKLTETNNKLAAEVETLKTELRRAKWTIWLLSLIVSPLVAVAVKTLLEM